MSRGSWVEAFGAALIAVGVGLWAGYQAGLVFAGVALILKGFEVDR